MKTSRWPRWILRVMCVLLLGITPARAALPQAAPPATSAEAEETPENAIDWKEGPLTCRLSNLAEIDLPEGFVFADAKGAKTFLELTQNIPTNDELGIVLPSGVPEAELWFAIFEFNGAGYIKDEDKDDLDADDLLDTIREGTAQANEVRKKRGWGTIEVAGWQKEPAYDPKTNNLSWAILGQDAESKVVNYSTRLLGRKGYMNVNLVLSPELLPTALPQFEKVLSGFRYKEGHRYAEFKAGDKVAEYGLTALVAGGAGVVAAKTGLLAKFWKLIVAAVVAIGAFFKRTLGSLFGGSKERKDEDTVSRGG